MTPAEATRGPAGATEVAWPADLPGVFRRLARQPGCVWLDSAGGPRHLARWSVLTAAPDEVLAHPQPPPNDACPDPFDGLRAALGDMAAATADLPFGPGLYGYLAYDLGLWVEPTARLSPVADTDLPELWMGRYGCVLVLDHHARHAHLVGEPGPSREALADALADPLPAPPETPPAARAAPTENLTQAAFRDAVARAREHIAAGDIFQVNLSRRLSVPAPADPAETYLRLRQANAAPYAAYVGLGPGQTILSSSPELFLELAGGRAVTRPIKGTRPRRPDNAAFNRRMRAGLLASPKDRAELVMIVDLERNDLGRVARYGTVRVAEPRAVEAYAAVHHTVATVEADLAAGRDAVDLLRATFPGGSITGAPKVRAMQIIADLEPTRRSVYTGAIGHLGPPRPGEPAGRCRLNIAIRTLLVGGGRLHLQVGGGIVADSDPQAEFDETCDKARAMLAALGLPGEGAPHG